jgi:hypothetical protein
MQITLEPVELSLLRDLLEQDLGHTEGADRQALGPGGAVGPIPLL